METIQQRKSQALSIYRISQERLLKTRKYALENRIPIANRVTTRRGKINKQIVVA